MYKQFNIMEPVKLSLNYLTSMVDKENDYLPYWLINVTSTPAFARHCRVDDAELVASWYEAIDSVQEMLNVSDGEEVKAGFQRHLLKSWGPMGLRYHESYPWTNSIYSSFHEMAYVLSALNRWQQKEPDNEQIAARAKGLVSGMRELVIQRKTRTFWSSDCQYGYKIYEFPNDVYLRDKGWDFSCCTGRGEQSIRNGILLHPLVKRYELFNDPVALDLAEGLAEYGIGLSRYFSYDGQFFGHVHSAVWFAAGLVLLGRLTDNERFLRKGKQIYDYVLSLSSSFGWVPEYARWRDPSEEYCETCCIKDIIECGFELIDAGYDEYWEVINNYVRNQLVEQQIKDTSFIIVEDTKDTADTTYRNLDKRVVGGFSGGSEPNSISLQRFRSIAGCCVGTAPQAFHMVWKRIITSTNNKTIINLPIETENVDVCVETGYPNSGWLRVIVKASKDLYIRPYSFMKEKCSLKINNRVVPLVYNNGLIYIPSVQKADVVELSHLIGERWVEETLRNTNYRVLWKGCDVVDIRPQGMPLRLYQRIECMPYDVSKTECCQSGEINVAKPTEQTP